MKKKINSKNRICDVNTLFEEKIKQQRQIASVWKFVATESLRETEEHKKTVEAYSKITDKVISELYKATKLNDINKIKTIIKQLHFSLIDSLHTGD